MMIPFLFHAYSRACEYTSDRFGAYYQKEGSYSGILVLAAGKKLYNYVNPDEFLQQAQTDRGFWVVLSELLSTHPNLPKRFQAIHHFNNKPSSSLPKNG